MPNEMMPGNMGPGMMGGGMASSMKGEPAPKASPMGMPHANPKQSMPMSHKIPTSDKRRQEEIAQQCVREFQNLWSRRGTFESHWDEIARRVLPAQAGMFNPFNVRTPGEKRTWEMYDSTAALALGRFAAILDSLLTPRNQTWHKLRASSPAVNKDRQVALWFDEVNRILFRYRYSPKANFSSQNQKNYRSLGAFGTGCMFVDELYGEPGLRYKAITLAQVYVSENHQGVVDKAIRRFKLTARQAVQKFGMEALPETVTQALNVNPDTEFEFLHTVKPREDRDPERKDFRGMPFASYYVSVTGTKLVAEGGFTTFPYAVSRYEQTDDEIYGRSPAMDALPAIKTLNEEKKTVLKAGHRIVDPVLLGPDDGVLDAFSLRPGAYNAGGVTADGRPLVHTLPTGRVDIGKELMDDERKLINDVFLVNLFQILTESPQMTATEVMERTREKGILLAPTIGRQQSEYLGPMVERELDILAKQGVLPPMPELLREAKGEYTIEYDSPLSRAQRAEEASGIMRTLEQAIAYFNATQDPSVMDFLNIDEIIPAIADINGVPPKWMRTIDEVQAIRAGRQQQQQDQQMIQAAPAAAAVMKAQASMAPGRLAR